MRRNLLIAVTCAVFLGTSLLLFSESSKPEDSIEAMRYSTSPDVPVSDLEIGAPKEENVDIACVVSLIRGGGRALLFDSGFHRNTFLKDFPMQANLRPDEAVKTAGVQPDAVTDMVISQAHWGHMGGIDRFPRAQVWIQKDEDRYYTIDAWGGDLCGIGPEDVKQLVQLNTEGRLHLVDGDNVGFFPGIRAYTSARPTCASQYLRIDGNPPNVPASDTLYLCRTLSSQLASATFSDSDHAANIANQTRMIERARLPDRAVPGHDALQFQKFPTTERVAKIK